MNSPTIRADHPGRIVAALACTIALTSAVPQADPRAETLTLVARLRAGETTAAEASRHLDELGLDALPTVFELACGALEPEVQRLGHAEVELVRTALPHWGGAGVVRTVTGLVSPTTSLDARLVAVDFLGASGDHTAVSALAQLFDGLTPAQQRQPVLCAPFTDALAEVLTRDTRSLATLDDLVARNAVGSAWLPCVAAAAGEVPGAATLPLLRRLLARDEGRIVRAALEALTSSAEPLEAARAAERFLDDFDAKTRRTAAATLGRLGGRSAAHALVAHLDDTDRRVTRRVQAALAEISGRHLDEDVAAWERWLTGEEEWYQASFERCVEAATHGERAAALHALRELAAHPALRHEIAAALAPLAEHADDALRHAALNTRARLGLDAAG